MKRLIALLCCIAVQTVNAADTTKGKAVFQHWCEPCHGHASYLPATAALQIKYKGKIAAALEDRKDLTAASVKTFVRQGAFSMAPFRKTEISDADLDALASYLSRK